jgi:hypothetical protein
VTLGTAVSSSAAPARCHMQLSCTRSTTVWSHHHRPHRVCTHWVRRMKCR